MSHLISPVLSLAFSMHSNPGVYALLLGSGLSRPAGIPTGWEVVLDLIRKLAHLLGEDCERDPAAWYTAKLGQVPDYARLLEAIAKSPAERTQLLRGYFEPTEEEREQGLRMPTAAHKAIAELVAAKYVRVIITTNFDRLLEKALEELGVAPTVISTPDAAEGSLPLTHTKCTVIKVNGDYLDTRIKNTPKELAHYDKRLNHLLDRVLDEFGLIICGWSAEWDTALRAAVERCKTRRFTTFWTTRSKPRDPARRLVTLRDAQIVQIQSADSFFRELADKIHALEDVTKPHPLTARVAVAMVKRYLVDDKYRIRLNDLIMDEAEKLVGQLSENNFPIQGVPVTAEELSRRLRRYEALTGVLQAVVVTGCYWGTDAHERLWVKCLERIANPLGNRYISQGWADLSRYPALLTLYGGGIATVAAERYDTLASLLTKPTVREDNRDVPVFCAVNTAEVLDWQHWKRLPGMERHYTPVSDHLYSVLREPLREYLPDDVAYQKCFDRFEYLLALVNADLNVKLGRDIWGPVGRFGWQGRLHGERAPVITEIESESSTAGSSWPPLRAGLFDGSLERFQTIKHAFDQWLRGLQL